MGLGEVSYRKVSKRDQGSQSVNTRGKLVFSTKKAFWIEGISGQETLFQGVQWLQKKGKMLVALGVQTPALRELGEKGKFLISSEKTSCARARPGVGLTIDKNLIYSDKQMRYGSTHS